MAPLPAGVPAPDFTLAGSAPDGVHDYRLGSMRGQVVVLAFYPADGTPVCTRQLCSYRDELPVLADVGATVWAISTQDVESHRRFAAQHGLTFPLLADPDGAVHRAYGLGGVLNRRAVFVVGIDGVVAWRRVSLTSLRYVGAAEIAAAVRRTTPAQP